MKFWGYVGQTTTTLEQAEEYRTLNWKAGGQKVQDLRSNAEVIKFNNRIYFIFLYEK